MCPLGNHLFQGQSLDPVPRPPLPFTHLWPAIPAPASLGMKSQTEIPGDCSVESPFRGEILKFPLWGDDSTRAFIFHLGGLIAALLQCFCSLIPTSFKALKSHHKLGTWPFLHNIRLFYPKDHQSVCLCFIFNTALCCLIKVAEACF